MKRPGLALGVLLLAAAAGAAEPQPRRPRVRRTPPTDTPAATDAAPGGPAVLLSAEVSGYGDTDAVYVASPTLSFGLADALSGWSLGARYLVDAVSAASVDIVSTASSKWREYRHVGSANLELKGGGVGLALAGGFSREPDYLSRTAGGTLSLELMDKNFMPFVGGSYGLDLVGRTGEPRALWRTMRRSSAQTGATFIVGRSTIAAVTMDGIFERGYLGKPYRYVPLFGPEIGDTLAAGAPVSQVNRVRLDQRPADAVPDARDRFALSGRIAHRISASTLRADQRLYRDSWGLTASTTDARILVDAGSRVILWPHLRLHGQRGISFWRRAYEAVPATDGTLGIPRFRTGDRELGPLGSLTLGAGLRWRLSEGGSPWTLLLQADGVLTRYYDALYIRERRALFTTVGIEAALN